MAAEGSFVGGRSGPGAIVLAWRLQAWPSRDEFHGASRGSFLTASAAPQHSLQMVIMEVLASSSTPVRV
jgi:hypothetical protein